MGAGGLMFFFRLWRRGRSTAMSASGREVLPVLEAIESRVLLAVTCGLASGTWSVSSDGSDDVITINKVGSNYQAVDGATTHCSQAAAAVTAGIVVHGNSGADTLMIDP